MLKVLIDLLTPIFTAMGVSPVDVQTYVNSMSGYIYAILGTLVFAVAVMIAAHFLVKKGTRHVVRWGAGLAWVLAVTVLANMICFGPLYNNLSIILNSTARVTEESAAVSKTVIEEIGEEGMVDHGGGESIFRRGGHCAGAFRRGRAGSSTRYARSHPRGL